MDMGQSIQYMTNKAIIDISLLSELIGYEEYIDYFSIRKNVYSLAFLKNSEIIRLFIEYQVDRIKNKRVSPETFRNTLRELSLELKSIPNDGLDNISDFKDYLLNEEVFHPTKRYSYIKVHKSLKEFVLCKDRNGNVFEYPSWNLETDFNISEDRKNRSRNFIKLNFMDINDDLNRLFIKKYLFHLITETNNSIMTIVSASNVLKSCLNLINKPYNEWNKNDMGLMFDLKRLRNCDKSIGSIFLILRKFTDFLVEKEYLYDSPIKFFLDIGRTGAYEYKSTAVEKYVVSQIFEKLNQVDEYLRIWFLIIKCTGMRGSEATSIKKDCLALNIGKNGEYVYSINYYSSKMKKDVTNLIPKSLYIMIDQYSKNIDQKSRYLFPSKKHDSPIQVSTMSTKMKKALKKLEIKNLDGTPYEFRPHEYRHLMAVRMREEDVPLQFIQEQLHHESPEMTMAYMEYVDRKKISMIHNFYDNNGNLAPLDIDTEYTDDELYVDYMSKSINARALINGVCAKSAKLFPCPHANACLQCSEFRTNSSYLPELIEQLKRSEKLKDKAKENGWLPQIKTSENDCKVLRKLIDKLEGLSEEIEKENDTDQSRIAYS